MLNETALESNPRGRGGGGGKVPPVLCLVLSRNVTCIRPLTEYSCLVYHNSLTNYLSDDLERLQKRAMRIIYTELRFTEALEKAGLQTLFKRRQDITERFFNQIVTNQSHRLHSLLPEYNASHYYLRNNRRFVHPACKTKRYQNSFINYNVARE